MFLIKNLLLYKVKQFKVFKTAWLSIKIVTKFEFEVN